MLFIVDECTDGGGVSVGMTWYVELEGEPFPNARGASFYRINPETGKLVYARDVVEPPAKLGDVSFSIIRAVAPLVKQQLRAQREKRGDVSTSSVGFRHGSPLRRGARRRRSSARLALYALGAAYWFVLLLSPPVGRASPASPRGRSRPTPSPR